ncbi:hypothetical protein BH10CYA1_BH10CYA1_06980 [soil metagenome]
MYIDFQTLGIFVVVLAVLSALADLLPNSPFRLKDLNAPTEELANHEDVWKLIFSSPEKTDRKH